MTRPAAFLPDDLRLEIIEHCRGELPNEGCGLVAVRDGVVVRVYPTGNVDRSPVSYTVPPEEYLAAIMDAEQNGWDIGGVFHSHPKGPAQMSATDLDRALEPGWTYFVVGFGSDEAEVSAHTL